MIITNIILAGMILLILLQMIFIKSLIDSFIKTKTKDVNDFKEQIVNLSNDYKTQINNMADRFMSFNIKAFEDFKDYEKSYFGGMSEEKISDYEGKPDDELQKIADKEGIKINTLDDIE